MRARSYRTFRPYDSRRVSLGELSAGCRDTTVGPVAMEHAEIELLFGREMPYTGHKRRPERPIIGPCGKDFVDGRIANGRFPSGVCWHRQALPLHPGVEHP